MSAVTKPPFARLAKLPALALATLPFLASACASGSVAVSPADIPTLERQLSERPTDETLLVRYAGALFSDGRCDLAVPAAERAAAADPSSPVPALVHGQCLEQSAEYDEALDVYGRYTRSFPGTSGADVVEGRAELARRARAQARARAALAQEATIGDVDDPESMGVLPLLVPGDPDLQPLSLGLAHLISADLALLQRFRMVERLELDAIREELALSDSDRVDPTTAARVGRLARAGRLFQGSLAGGQDAPVDLTATVLPSDGAPIESDPQRGRFNELLVLEKQLVLDVAQRLGYVLGLDEQRLIMENGTQSLIAFLSFSAGLDAERAGDFALAAQHYAEAVRADPGFGEARGRMRTAAGAGVVSSSSPGEVTTVEGDVADATNDAEQVASTPSPIDAAVISSIIDVSGTQAEKTTIGGEATGTGDTPWDDPIKPQPRVPPSVITAIIQFTIIIP